MYTAVALLIGVILPLLLGAAFLLGRHFQRSQASDQQLSPVSQQHIDLFQGGQINEAAVEAAKVRFRELLERGDVAMVEASLRPGVHYLIQVRALAEIGTDTAGRILERQLQRRLSEDQLEQSWYFFDLASSLRVLNRQESLPHLLRCADNQASSPLSHFFAAETACFLGFGGYVRQAETPLGRSALRLLHRVLEGLRYDLPPQIVTEARLGEVIENLWDHPPARHHPLLVRIAREVLRLLRRAPHARHFLAGEKAEEEAYSWQISRLSTLEPMLLDFVEQAPAWLLAQLETSTGRHRVDVLQALSELRVDASEKLIPLLLRPHFGPVDHAMEVLSCAKNPRVGPWMCNFVSDRLPVQRRTQWRKRAAAPSRPSVPRDVPYRAVLAALRGHPSEETEKFLMQATRDWDPTYRQTACGSLGWWEPIQRPAVLACLQTCRRDPSPEVRQSARAALARLGERQALHWFRHALTGEDMDNVYEAMRVIAAEGLVLLWPELDRLADADNLDIAHHAREALERLHEDLENPRLL